MPKCPSIESDWERVRQERVLLLGHYCGYRDLDAPAEMASLYKRIHTMKATTLEDITNLYLEANFVKKIIASCKEDLEISWIPVHPIPASQELQEGAQRLAVETVIIPLFAKPDMVGNLPEQQRRITRLLHHLSHKDPYIEEKELATEYAKAYGRPVNVNTLKSNLRHVYVRFGIQRGDGSFNKLKRWLDGCSFV